MTRTFGPQTLSATAMPWFGDLLTAAVLASPFAVNSQNIRVTVAKTSIYQVGDRIILNPGAAGSNIFKINKIVSSTVLQCQSEGDAAVNAFPIGTIIALAINCWCIDFQLAGAAVGYLAADSTGTNVPGGSVYRELLPATANVANSYQITKGTGQNSLNTADGWMVGTTGTILIAAHVN
jgi:hypothetical protein